MWERHQCPLWPSKEPVPDSAQMKTLSENWQGQRDEGWIFSLVNRSKTWQTAILVKGKFKGYNLLITLKSFSEAGGDSSVTCSLTGSVELTSRMMPRLLPAHKALQDGALPGALLAHHRDLRQLEAAALPGAAQGVLQAVDQRDQLLHPPVAHRSKSSRTSAVSGPVLHVFTIVSRHRSPIALFFTPVVC